MTYHYSRPSSMYVQSRQTQPSSSSRPSSVYVQTRQTQQSSSSRPSSVYVQTRQNQQSSSSTQRPFSVVGCEGYEGYEGYGGYDGHSSLRQTSFRVIRHRQQRKNVRTNMLNPTLDNFYNTLRRAEADLNVKSAKSWISEYERYRRQVINDEKSSISNTRPVSCYSTNMVTSPTNMEYQRYSMHF